MNRKKNIFLPFVALIFFTFLLNKGLSIKCWACRSDFDDKCGDPFDNSSFPIRDCKQDPPLSYEGQEILPTMCRKIRQKVNNKWIYHRSCAYLGEPGIGGDERFCLMRSGTYNIFIEYCTCNSKDGCNSAGLLKHNNILTYGLFLASIIVKFFRY